MERERIIVVVPYAWGETIQRHTERSLERLQAEEDLEVTVLRIQGWCPYAARNEGCREALAMGRPVLSIDSDIDFQPWQVRVVLKHPGSIVAIPYDDRHRPGGLCCGDWYEVPGILGDRLPTDTRGDCIVPWVGAGFLRIMPDVLKDMPWWFTPEKVIYNGVRQVAGDDAGFCMNAGAAGYRITALCDYRVNHKREDPLPRLDLSAFRLDCLATTSQLNEKIMGLCNTFEQYMGR